MPYWRQPMDIVSKIEPDRPIGESPVTIADQNCEKALRSLIESTYPSHGIYGEEFGSVRVDSDFVWVLDPIDGTKLFITGKPVFGTLIALLYKGVPFIGIIDQCVLKERWVGVTGRGTTFNGKSISLSDGKLNTTLNESMVYASSPHMFGKGYEERSWNAVCNAVKRPMYGADCYAYGLLASGYNVDLVVEADMGLYDYCALVPVVENAGGIMTDWNGNRLTLQNHLQGISKGRVVACTNPQLHREAITLLQQQETKSSKRKES
eukprot:CAMPEP_0194173510 /NCGR_PEP_ID=MMETSP0154-20130528/7827_1 /TAXON_ID=1049557 /ORGANISM="Thalassiothrix antarctica, Strain L6-D1" /LENGTH=263 /DNA_ID=CAMNT_0038886595 /DNA_START=65 /DNA_END=852 /DNA_ORIENTATION=-